MLTLKNDDYIILMVDSFSAADTSVTVIYFINPETWLPLTYVKRRLIMEQSAPLKNVIDPVNFRVSVDHDGRQFKEECLEKRLHNGEVVKRQWLMYSIPKGNFFCLPCILSVSLAELTPCQGNNDWLNSD